MYKVDNYKKLNKFEGKISVENKFYSLQETGKANFTINTRRKIFLRK